MPPRSLPRRHLVLFCIAAALLGACATLQPEQTGQQMIGSPESAVRQTFGPPTETHRLADGTSRWLWSRQPFGHEVYAADFDAAGRLIRYRQMLTEAEIYRARVGVWTKQDVQQHFGLPREPVQYYPLMQREAWSWRMYKDGLQTAHFSCYFDNAGVLRQTMIIVDPLGGDARRAR
ncbi:putative lipoprotein [Cupriavidus phytorum]|uniref:Lipoprotein n=2 Tax=Cupriavidus TaxID=106589 RepID=A0A975XKG3_9BURK|nr:MULTISPECIES: hypothetical protein [Cupriavidus]PZX23903.1 hypothetical protein C7416_11166 [Cupriavidus alkaliphilus]SOY75641.1 putative lipoprotein [Cupriavidus taiwanensis]